MMGYNRVSLRNDITITVSVLIALLLTGPKSIRANMQKISDSEMAEITAQAGISIYVSESGLELAISSIELIDAGQPPDTIQLQDVRITNSTGNPFSWDTPENNPITLDVAEDALGQWLTAITLSQFSDPIWISFTNIVYCDTAIGSLSLEHLIQEPYDILVQPMGGVDSGINWEATFKIDADRLAYEYNTNAETFELVGIHLFGTATGTPEDPATWEFTGPFQVADLVTDPATYEVGTDLSGKTMLVLGVPSTGSMRIEQINAGPDSFGPCAFDGIQTHRLSVTMNP